MATRDLYDVLGVARTASQEEIHRAYRILARRYHPDINTEPGAEERFKEISEAHEVLTDPQQRARYDRFGPAFRQVPPDYEPGAGAPFGAGPAGQRVYVRTGPGGTGFGATGLGGPGLGGPGLGGAGFGETGFGGTGFGGRPFGDVDLDELLGGLFGRGRASRRVPGADREVEIELSVEDAYTGGRRRLSVNTAGGPRSYEVNFPRG